MPQAFYRKWRPHHWEEVVAQDHIVQTLRNAVVADRVAHAYLFAGPRGTGKTTTARLLAKAVNCLAEDLSARPCDVCNHCQAVNEGRFLDLIEIDAASNTSVEDVRDLRDKINFSPNQGRFKIYIVDEVHMLSTAAFNALLKTLEEPPQHAIFVLATTEVHKIPATVLSRCQRHEFRRIPVKDMVALLSKMAADEGLQASEEALDLVARQATGSLRDAISLLDQLASTGASITLEMAHSVLGTATSQAVVDLVEALLHQQAAQGLELIHRALDSGSDPRHFGRQVVDYVRDLLLVRMGNAEHVDAPPEMRTQMASHAQAFTVGELLFILQAFNHAAVDARLSWQPALPLEMAFVQALEYNPSGMTEPGPGPVPSSPKNAPKTPPGGLYPQSKGKKTGTREEIARQDRPGENPAGESLASEQVPPPASSPDIGVTMEAVVKNWRQVLALVRQRNPQTQGLLNSCRPLGLKDGALYLGFNSDFSKAKMERPEHLDITQQVLNQVLGVKLPVHCVVAPDRAGKPLPDIDGNGMVATALRDLGGEIVDVQ